MRIPIFQGEAHLGFVRDEATLRRYAFAPNVEIVRKKKVVVRVEVFAVIEHDEEGHGIGPQSVSPVYKEDLPTGPLPMLKRLGPDGFVRWDSTDRFNPKRFNPDRLPRVSRVAAYA
jgi:hypothetical protein